MGKLQDVLRDIEKLAEKLRWRGSCAWYRGHARADWSLTSTLHRYIQRLLDADIDKHLLPSTELLREEAKSRFREFKRDAWPLLPPSERSEWGVLFAMQHYRLPTRLIDWSENLTCALFFAQMTRSPGDEAAVWVLDGQALNEISVQQDGVIALDERFQGTLLPSHKWHPTWRCDKDEELTTIAVDPIYTNPRMVAQRARFTLAGDTFEPLEKQFDGRLLSEGVLTKFSLPSDTFDDLEAHLRLAGASPYSYFPDLEGVALAHERETEVFLRDLQLKQPKNRERPS